MAQEVWLIRHAETEWSKAGRHTGRTDVPLTDAGCDAARALRSPIGDRDWALVLTSPLGRARETAALAGLGDRAAPREDLLEWDYGDYEGITTAAIQAERPGWSLFPDGCPHGETADEVGARVDRVIAEALAADGDVALFAHGHVLRVLGARWAEQPARFGMRLALSTAAICVLGFEHDERVIWRWNRTG